MPKYCAALAHEGFQPNDLLTQAGEAELAGFDGVCCSDHLAPWWTEETAPTASGNAWVWLGAVARETKRCDIGSAVTAIVHLTARRLPPDARRSTTGADRDQGVQERVRARAVRRALPNGEDEVPDALFTKQVICSSGPATHVKRIRLIEQLGADVMVLMNVSGADPHAALRVYGDQVLPKLKA